MNKIKHYIIPFLLFLILLVIYFSNMRNITASDSIPTRLLPLSVIYERDFDLDEYITQEAWHVSKKKMENSCQNTPLRLLSWYCLFIWFPLSLV
jgi:hypothetical protein